MLFRSSMPPELLKQCPYTERDLVTPLVEELLGLSPRPTAIFCSDDIIAAKVLQTAQMLELKVPEDLAVAGFGNIPISTRVFPELTTVDVPRYELGREAMMMFSQIKNKQFKTKEPVVLPAALVERNST